MFAIYLLDPATRVVLFVRSAFPEYIATFKQLIYVAVNVPRLTYMPPREANVLKVMIAEDDLMIADMTEALLEESGYEVCGIARTVEGAVELAAGCKPDLALIDMRLADGGLGTQIAARLAPFLGLGVLYASGNTMQAFMTAADGHAYLTKPYTSVDLLRALVLVRSLSVNGTADQPFPRGFQVLPPAPSTFLSGAP